MKVNLNTIQEHVRVQYGDLAGVIQIDGHSNISSIYDLCEDYKFNTNDIFIIGFGMGESSIQGIGEYDEVCCSIFYVTKEEYGETYDEVENKIQIDRHLKLKKKNINVKYSTIGKYIKRYNFIAVTEVTKSAMTIEIAED